MGFSIQATVANACKQMMLLCPALLLQILYWRELMFTGNYINCGYLKKMGDLESLIIPN
jgi:hypothetical protein